MSTIIGLCGYLGSGRQKIANAIPGDIKQVSLLAGIVREVTPSLKRVAGAEPVPGQYEIPTRRLVLQYRRAVIDITGDPLFWVKMAEKSKVWNTFGPTTPGALVIPDVMDVEEAKWVEGFRRTGATVHLFCITKLAQVPALPEEAQNLAAIRSAIGMEELDYESGQEDSVAETIRQRTAI